MTDAIIDMTELSARHTSARSARRVRARHRAERRLKAYGTIAISLAAFALATLVCTIVVKALSASTVHHMSLDVDLEATDRQIAIMSDGNPATRVDLKKPLRAALRDAANADLSGRKARPLNALLSKFEGYELSNLVEAEPDLLGSTHRFEALLDDDVQLYLKGDFGELENVGAHGAIEIAPGESPDEAIIRIPATALGEARRLMRTDRAAEARQYRRSARNLARAVEQTEARLLEDAGDRARLEGMIRTFEADLDATSALADRALAEATDGRTVFRMRSDDPTIFIRANGGWIKVVEMGPEELKGRVLEAPDALGRVAEGGWQALVFETPEGVRRIDDRQIVWLERFRLQGRLISRFNLDVLLNSDSSSAELAGIWGALIGSFWTMMVTFLLVFPVGVMASIYLEEFAPKNRLTNIIEVNINNLAAVPSIVFGLLGLTVLLSGVALFDVKLFDGLLKAFAEDPRSTPLVGGVVLALMSLPTIIIAARASIKAVPPSIRDAALALGASKLQTSTQHVLPLAMPGIMTGSIIAMAQALGETAPLIIIGMNSFIQEPPADPLDKANVLPSLIYLWNNNSERLFEGKTAVAITILLLFLVTMNALAVVLRKRFERRW